VIFYAKTEIHSWHFLLFSEHHFPSNNIFLKFRTVYNATIDGHIAQAFTVIKTSHEKNCFNAKVMVKGIER
jgi:hypothetical protein